MPGLSSNKEIIWEYLDQAESEFLYHEIFVNKSYFQGITLSEGDIVVDAGANIGLFSLFCLSRCRNLKICVFEPIQPIFEVLKRNLIGYFQNNNRNNLHLFNCALGSKNENNQIFYYFPSAPGESTRYLKERSNQKNKIQQLIRNSPDPLVQELFPKQSLPPLVASTHKRKAGEMEPPPSDLRVFGDAETCSTNVITLSTAMKQTFGDDCVIDLLKIDVEGDEWNILLGILSSEDDRISPSSTSLVHDDHRPTIPLIRRIRQIVLEVHDQPLETQSILTNRSGRLDHIVDFLQYYGFTVTVEQQLSRICDGTSYFMYIPPELNLYYVYAIHSSFSNKNNNTTTINNNNNTSNNNIDNHNNNHINNNINDPNITTSATTLPTPNPKLDSLGINPDIHTNQVADSNTVLTTEDFETLLAVLEEDTTEK